GESIVSKVDKDINSDKITLFYQPQYQDGKIVSFEGLLRFKYLEDSYLYPPIVVNLSLENNIFKDLSKEVVKRALSDLNDFVKYNKDFTMTINLRLELLVDEEFMDFLFEEVKKSNLQDYAFGIELTEETYLPSSLDLSSVFKKIHENKISIYLDDFSMGSTSLTYLQNNHFDYVKLDGSLVSNIENERSKNIIGSIISLGKDLDFKVIAEYVETEVQEKILKELGCDIVQGYLYSKAVAKEEIIKLLSK
ncbi:MAG: EAL domain-containing protein, partial [Bacilli bacterium]|nr:EAL domain-containing protein [Bacilli bacterium]MDY5898904.1 EAL domain-containing protein [Bacilli bacterium]